MSGPGRPNKDEVAQRRQRIRLFLAVSAAASEQAVKRIAEELGVGERAVRGDLEAIRDQVEHAPSDDLSHDLLHAIEGADTFKLLKALGKKVMHEMVRGTIDRALGSALVEALREQRQVLLRERDEHAQVALTALEVLTPRSTKRSSGIATASFRPLSSRASPAPARGNDPPGARRAREAEGDVLMSGGLGETHPEGRGFEAASRGKARVDATRMSGVETTWTPNDKQARALASDAGIDLIVGGLGSGKSDVGALKLIRWALKYPRRKDGSPTKWLILGPDFSLLREEQMQKILEQAARFSNLPYSGVVRRVCYGQDPRIYLCHDQVLLCRCGTEPRRMRGHRFSGTAGVAEPPAPPRTERHPETLTVSSTRTRSERASRRPSSATACGMLSPGEVQTTCFRYVSSACS